MQYGLKKDIFKDNNSKVKINDKLKIDGASFIVIIVATFLLSRVIIFMGKNDVAGLAPFGIVALLAISTLNNELRFIAASIGALAGYFTIATSVKDGLVYIIAVLMISGYSFIAYRFKGKIKINGLFLLYFASQILYGMVVNGFDIISNILMSGANTIIIVPIFFIINYAINCIEKYNTNYLFNIEEVVSISLILCLIVAGFGNINIGQINIRTVIALGVVVVAAYLGGAANGAAIGISMGIVFGLTSGNMIQGIGFYGVIGFTSGLFKDTGKIFSILSAIVVYIILGLYSETLSLSGLIEILIGGGVVLLIPKNFVKTFEKELDKGSKAEDIHDAHVVQIKEEFTERINKLGDSLKVVSKSIESIGTNNVLTYKDRSTEIIESLVDRVCANCKNGENCWRYEFNQVYTSFELLVQSRERKEKKFPAYLEKICLKKYDLIDNADNVILASNARELSKRKLEESRHMIAENINNISNNFDKMINDFKTDVSYCLEYEKRIKRELNKSSVKYNDIFCYTDRNGKIKIKINMDNCNGARYCYKNLLPIISEIIRKPMMITDGGCRISLDNKKCSIILAEMPKFKIESCVNLQVKKGEEKTGDSYMFGNLDNGNYMTLLSDGMGSGPAASNDSKVTVDLAEKFIESGFDIDTTLNTINSIMAMKFEEDEKFSTLDMNLIDVYTGIASFTKVGATSSFIKRGKEIIKVSSNMPPFGLVDKIEVESAKHKIRNGDVIITLSDGVLDVNKDRVGDGTWLEEFLVNRKPIPKDLVVDILEESKSINNGKIDDDMTIIVSKVHALY